MKVVYYERRVYEGKRVDNYKQCLEIPNAKIDIEKDRDFGLFVENSKDFQGEEVWRRDGLLFREKMRERYSGFRVFDYSSARIRRLLSAPSVKRAKTTRMSVPLAKNLAHEVDVIIASALESKEVNRKDVESLLKAV